MPPSQQQLERIVAYLDGELSAEESAQVEQQLATDADFRQALQGAERAWTALDELPMVQVDKELAHTTMEMVVVAARNDIEAKTIALPVQRRKHKTKTVLLATMVMLLGALVFRVLWNNPNRRLLADLPVIQNVDIYSQFQSIEFLQHLDRLLGKRNEKLSTSDAEQLQAKAVVFQQVAADDGREARLGLLSDDEKIVLRAKLNRFSDLSPQQKAEMRQLHEQLLADDDRQQLLQTMFRYQQWLSELSQSQQYEYRELKASKRAVRVVREMERAASKQQFELSQKQLQRLLRIIRPYIQKTTQQNQGIFEQELAKMPKRDQRQFRARAKPEQMMWAFQFAMRHSGNHTEMMQAFNDVVVGALPDEMQEPYQLLPFWEKADLMRSWLWQARSQVAKGRRSGTKLRAGDISEQEFADFFVEELDPAEKERLLALPRDQMQQQLRQMILGRSPRRRGPMPSEWNPRRPPPHGPPGDRRRGRPPRGPGPGGRPPHHRPPHGPPPGPPPSD